MRESLLQLWTGLWPDVKVAKPLPNNEGVLDQSAFDAIEVEQLFTALNHAHTVIGAAVLHRSLAQPLDNLEDIHAKQQAVQEIRANPDLQAALEGLVQQAAQGENSFYLLLFGEFLGSMGTAREAHQIEGFGYSQYRRGLRFILDFVAQVKSLTPTKSSYLNSIIAKVQAFSATREFSLMEGPVYLSERGIQSKQERIGSFIPAVVFKPRLFKPLLIALILGCLWSLELLITGGIFNPLVAIFMAPMLLIYVPIVGGYDRDKAIIPLRNVFRQSAAVGEALDALGEFDELLSFIRYAEAFNTPIASAETSLQDNNAKVDTVDADLVLPTFVSATKHQINLSGLKNPVLGNNNPAYVANNLIMEQERLVLITGPNSGGKTAFCKTVTQTQVMAQIGCFIPATAATLSVADKVFYQVPEISQMADGEGRFGTELKRTKEIFLASSANSLVVLDELSEGTTFEEKMESSTNVLNGFYRKGGNTILITHNHQLVDHFIKDKIGVAKQVEFSNDMPTYKLIDGISRVSHADRVAKKIGFSKQDIDNYLAAE